jgi:uncharacterized protein YuzE
VVSDGYVRGRRVGKCSLERPERGDIVLDFDADGRLLGVEVIGATELLRRTVLDTAERI